jgi:hypothetical protein
MGRRKYRASLSNLHGWQFICTNEIAQAAPMNFYCCSFIHMNLGINPNKEDIANPELKARGYSFNPGDPVAYFRAVFETPS